MAAQTGSQAGSGVSQGGLLTVMVATVHLLSTDYNYSIRSTIINWRHHLTFIIDVQDHSAVLYMYIISIIFCYLYGETLLLL